MTVIVPIVTFVVGLWVGATVMCILIVTRDNR